MTTLEFLTGILTSQFDVDPAELTPGSALRDVAVDSLAAIELSLELEREYGFPVTEEEILSAETVSTLAELLDRRIKEAA